MKKLLSLAMVAIMLLSCMTFVAFAEEETLPNIIWDMTDEEMATSWPNQHTNFMQRGYKDGTFIAKATGTDDYILRNLVDAGDAFSADDYRYMKIKYLAESDQSSIFVSQMWFSLKDGVNMFYSEFVITADGQWQTAIVDMAANPNWCFGDIAQLMYRPFTYNQGFGNDGETIRIAYIGVFATEEEAEAFDILVEGETPTPNGADALAEDLKTLGLFIGTENGFELDRAPTRIEALVMLIRLLGVENDAKNGTWSHPFTDVPDWAAPYVGYAYENGLTAGVSDTLFGTDELSNAAQYLTFVLRALGYSDADGDFVWNKSNEKAAEIGLIGADDYPDLENGEFLRADTVIISYSALSVNMKDTETSLVASLIDKGAVDADLAADLGIE